MAIVTFDELRLETDDGMTLDAIVQRPDAPIGSMLLVHGFGPDVHAERAFDALAAQLCAAGIAVLQCSFQGHGKSNESPTGVSLSRQRCDLVAAYRWMTVNLPGPYALLGASFGAVGITTELRALDPAPRCVALWSPALEINGMFGKQLLEAARVATNDGKDAGRELLEECAGYHGNLGMRHLGTIPALIVHGTNDQVVPLASSVAAATARKVDLVVLQGAAHEFLEPQNEVEAIQITTNWILDRFQESRDQTAKTLRLGEDAEGRTYEIPVMEWMGYRIYPEDSMSMR